MNTTDTSTTNPIIAALPDSQQPQPSLICQTCPHSVWLRTKTEVKSYCKIMHLVTWQSGQTDPIEACSGALEPVPGRQK